MISSIYTEEQLELISCKHIPHHIAIIPDGNRRWAKNQYLDTPRGHQEGCDTLMGIVKAASELGVKVLTVYTFSTENWSRPREEVNFLMNLLESYLRNQSDTMVENGIRLHTIGDPSSLPQFVINQIETTKKNTENCNKIDLVLAVNYGARNEIKRAITELVKDLENKKIHKEEITEQTLHRYLDTAHWPDPDLLIRTSGEYRISNFLLWQLSYAEIYFSSKLWPDFTFEDLYTAIRSYQKRTRRLGE